MVSLSQIEYIKNFWVLEKTKNESLNEQQKQSRDFLQSCRRIVQLGAHCTLPRFKETLSHGCVWPSFQDRGWMGHSWELVLIPLSQSRMEKTGKRAEKKEGFLLSMQRLRGLKFCSGLEVRFQCPGENSCPFLFFLSVFLLLLLFAFAFIFVLSS